MIYIPEDKHIEIKNTPWLKELAEQCLDRFFVRVKPFYYEGETYCWVQKSHITWVQLAKNCCEWDALTDERYFRNKKEALEWIKQCIEEDINYFIFEERE